MYVSRLMVSSTFALDVACLFVSLHFLLSGEELGSKLTSLYKWPLACLLNEGANGLILPSN